MGHFPNGGGGGHLIGTIGAYGLSTHNILKKYPFLLHFGPHFDAILQIGGRGTIMCVIFHASLHSSQKCYFLLRFGAILWLNLQIGGGGG